MPSKARAFTLIELLVVIGIIALLAAIVFPLMAQAKLRAKSVVSISQIKQLAAVQTLYCNDNSGGYATDYNGRSWIGQLEPYFPGIRKFHPPTFPKIEDQINSIGYAINGCIRPFGGAKEFGDESSSVMFAEATVFRIADPLGMSYYNVIDINCPDHMLFERLQSGGTSMKLTPLGPFASQVYFGKGAYAFLDGHAALAREEQFEIPPPPSVCNVPDENGPASGKRYRFARRAER